MEDSMPLRPFEWDADNSELIVRDPSGVVRLSEADTWDLAEYLFRTFRHTPTSKQMKRDLKETKR
jgi:hypothetical protein